MSTLDAPSFAKAGDDAIDGGLARRFGFGKSLAEFGAAKIVRLQPEELLDDEDALFEGEVDLRFVVFSSHCLAMRHRRTKIHNEDEHEDQDEGRHLRCTATTIE